MKKSTLVIVITLLWGMVGVQAQDILSVERVTESAIGNGGRASAMSADGRYVVATGAYGMIDASNSGYGIVIFDQQTNTNILVSRNADGIEGNGFSNGATVSANGCVVAFQSSSTNLVDEPDTNDWEDIFVYDCFTDSVERVSIHTDGTEGDKGAARYQYPDISADGRFVVFGSDSTNLDDDDTNGWRDVFIRDRLLGTTERIVNSDGQEGNGSSYHPTISGDGRWIVFTSHATNLVDETAYTRIYIYDRDNQTLEQMHIDANGTAANGYVQFPILSGNGRYIAFESEATNLVANDNNDLRDAFVYDRQTGAIELVSVSSDGVQGNHWSYPNAISYDGRYVGFSTIADTIVENDTNGLSDAFVRDRVNHTTIRVSVSSTGAQVSGETYYSSYVDDFSVEGRFVTFTSNADNLVAGDTNNQNDVFIVELMIRDVNSDGLVSPSDAIYVINRLGTGDLSADIDGSGAVTADDVGYILDYLGG